MLSAGLVPKCRDVGAAEPQEVVVGDPLDLKTQVGPIVIDSQLSRICGLIDKACDEVFDPVLAGSSSRVLVVRPVSQRAEYTEVKSVIIDMGEHTSWVRG